MSERSSGWSGSMPTITFQWCLSQSATICSPLGIVRTRTTAGRLSDPNFAIPDSPCSYRIPAYRRNENLLAHFPQDFADVLFRVTLRDQVDRRLQSQVT